MPVGRNLNRSPTFVEAMRWWPFRNDAGQEIPAFAPCEISSITADGEMRLIKPTADSLLPEKVAFNGPTPIPASGYGSASRDYPLMAKLSGSPAAKTAVGTVAGQWYLASGKQHFQTWSAVSDGVAQVVPCVDRAGRGGCSSGSLACNAACFAAPGDWRVVFPTMTTVNQIVGFGIAGCARGTITVGSEGDEEVETYTTAGEEFFCDPAAYYLCASSQRIADPTITGNEKPLALFLPGVWAASSDDSNVAVTRTHHYYASDCIGGTPAYTMDDEFWLQASVLLYCERQMTGGGTAYDLLLSVGTTGNFQEPMPACCETQTNVYLYGVVGYYRINNFACNGPLLAQRVATGTYAGFDALLNLTLPETLTVYKP